MIFVGDDWVEDHHDVHVMDDTGARLEARRLPDGLAGIDWFHQLLANCAAEPDEVIVRIETDRGLWVQALAAADYQVYAINPLAGPDRVWQLGRVQRDRTYRVGVYAGRGGRDRGC